MSKITIQSIELLMDQMFDKKLEPILETQRSHTESLALLVSRDKTKKDNQTVVGHRLDRLENWSQQVGNKLDIKLEL